MVMSPKTLIPVHRNVGAVYTSVNEGVTNTDYLCNSPRFAREITFSKLLKLVCSLLKRGFAILLLLNFKLGSDQCFAYGYLSNF
jgi:hypothetical protein